MSEMIGNLCNNMRQKLSSLESRMESLETNVGATWRLFQDKLDESRARTDASEELFAHGRTALLQWYDHQRIEMSAMRNQWELEHTPEEAADRAAIAERHLQVAIRLAEMSLDEVERMVLETIAARHTAESMVET